jgi:hypothetical protein
MRFAVIGDRTGGHEPGIYGQVVHEVQRMRPDFVLQVGDMIEGYTGDTSKVSAEWREYLPLLEPLTMPIYHAPGNHDIWDENSLDLYRAFIGEPYYSFDVGEVHFVALNTSLSPLAEDFPAEQLAWLRDDLARHRGAEKIIVFYHHPHWIETVASGKPDPLHEAFVEYGVDAVFTGHYHVYFSGAFDGVLYTGVGSSGGGCSPGITGLKYHFMWVTLDGEEIAIAPIRKDAVLPWEEVTAAQFRFVDRVGQEAISGDKLPLSRDMELVESSLRVEVRNLNEEVAIEDTLRWHLPEGWMVEPEILPISVEPGGAFTARFGIANTGTIYPCPDMVMAYPYAPGKTFEVEWSPTVARTATAHRARRAPEIDGNVEEGIWKEAVTHFFAPDGSPVTTDPVEFYFAWDADNLYLAARCSEAKIDSVVASGVEHDFSVFGEDCVGFFFQPDTADGPVYQIYFSAIGTAFDQKIDVERGYYTDADRDWNGTYDVAAARDDESWSIEIAIPLAQLGASVAGGNEWAINFRRKQRRVASTADWMVPIGYNPAEYGTLVFQ